MKKSKLFLAGMAALLLSFGLVLAGCDDGNGDDGGGNNAPPTDGKITITGVPAGNAGKYAYVSIFGDDELWGGSNWVGENTLHGVAITTANANSLEIPIWKEVDHKAASYSGNDTFSSIDLYISTAASVTGSNWQGELGSSTKTFSSVTFDSGKVTVAWQ